MRKEEFEGKLQRLKEINPSHDIIPAIEELGYSFISVEYLKLALEDPIQDKKEEEYTADWLYNKQSSLVSKRAQNSNKFHVCKSDKERAQVSMAIKTIQTELMQVRKLISQYKETGKLPKKGDKLDLPMDGMAQANKAKSLRTSRCRFEKKLRVATGPEEIEQIKNHLTRIADELAELTA